MSLVSFLLSDLPKWTDPKWSLQRMCEATEMIVSLLHPRSGSVTAWEPAMAFLSSGALTRVRNTQVLDMEHIPSTSRKRKLCLAGAPISKEGGIWKTGLNLFLPLGSTLKNKATFLFPDFFLGKGQQQCSRIFSLICGFLLLLLR